MARGIGPDWSPWRAIRPDPTAPAVRRAALACAGAAWIATAAAQSPAAAPAVYTAAQAARGKAHYEAYCASCHLGDLSGTLAADTGAPPLRGETFRASVEHKGLPAVFDYVKTTMPADDPSSLKDAEYLDIVAYLIQANGFPAGPRELTTADLPRLGPSRPSQP